VSHGIAITRVHRNERKIWHHFVAASPYFYKTHESLTWELGIKPSI